MSHACLWAAAEPPDTLLLQHLTDSGRRGRAYLVLGQISSVYLAPGCGMPVQAVSSHSATTAAIVYFLPVHNTTLYGTQNGPTDGAIGLFSVGTEAAGEATAHGGAAPPACLHQLAGPVQLQSCQQRHQWH